MLVRYAKNCFVRQYGPYSYFFNQISRSDEIYKDAQVFCEAMTRSPQDVEKLISDIAQKYVDANVERIRADFLELISHLGRSSFVVTGNSVDELDGKDPVFTYDVKSPKTAVDVAGVSLDRDIDDEHKLLRGYFENCPIPFRLHVDLTNACNERCVHCYVPQTGIRYFIEDAIAEKVIAEFRDMGGLQLTLSGGECLLHPQFKKILRYARSQDLAVSILSNLTMLDEDMASLFKDLSLSLVQTSLYSMDPLIHDSITKIKGSFFKTKTAIEMLHKLDVPVQISCPCMRLNYQGYKDVIKYANGMKMKSSTDFIMMGRSDGSIDNLNNRLTLSESESLMRAIFEHDPEMQAIVRSSKQEDVHVKREDEPICGVGIDSICLNADGNYYACSGFQGFPLGNCYSQTLSYVWNESPQILYLRKLRRGDIPRCVSCMDADFCSVCLVRNFNENGDMLKVAEHFCDVARLNHQLFDEYRNASEV